MARKAAAAQTASLPIEGGKLRMTNAEILNTVRKYAPDDYKARIPAATQGNVSATLKALNAYQNDWNVFWDVLHSRIGMTMIRNRGFVNPLAISRRVSNQYGTTIQEMEVNLLKAKGYEVDAINVFGLEGRMPDIHQQFYTMNSKLKYEVVTPMADVLRGAFTNETDLSALVNSIYAKPYDSMENDEYLQQMELFGEYQKNEGFYNIHVDDIASAQNDTEIAERCRKIARAVRTMNTRFKYYNTDYSAEGRQAGLSTRADGTYIVIPADVDAAMTVDMLAYMFNEENGKLLADRIVVVPKMPDNLKGCQALLLEDDFLLTADNLGPIMLQAPLNPVNMTQLRVLHIWRTLAYSRFAQGVMLSTLPDTKPIEINSTVTGVTLKDNQQQTSSTVESYVDANGYLHSPSIKLVATVEGTGSPSQAVRFDLEGYDGRGKAFGLPSDCYVDSMGVFHAGHTPAGTKVIIKATSIQDESKSAAYTATVEGSDFVTALTATPASVTIEEGASQEVALAFTPSNATDTDFTASLVDGTHAMLAVDRANHKVTVTGLTEGSDTLVFAATGSEPGTAVTKVVPITINANA